MNGLPTHAWHAVAANDFAKEVACDPRVGLSAAEVEMRHSDPSLTANVYTDPKLLDVAGAVASLPDLPLGEVGRPAGGGGAWLKEPPSSHPLAVPLHIFTKFSLTNRGGGIV